MNALTRDLKKLVIQIEKNNKIEDNKNHFRESIHLMPPVGWLNDPNGLCQFRGIYHAFFQYSPFDAEGGVKMWGHYTSENMLDWEYQGVALYPDQPFDCHGVYSGSAFVEDGKMYIYYTGNVKLEDGEYDYINTGREANTVFVCSEDGFHFDKKKELLRNEDYPANLTCHVRDPKVWKEGDIYYMIQGARTKENTGQALIFSSKNKEKWEFQSRVKSKESFGYMWECPDYFSVGEKKILSVSVQGLTGEEWKNHNVYQSGYFLMEGDIHGEYSLSSYHLWDYGFDYYAPQSFETEDGRRIHIGWMGMPDCEEYTNQTIKDGWQHCFTIPREIFVKNGYVCQRPIKELDAKKKLVKEEKNSLLQEGCPVSEIFISNIKDNDFQVILGEELILDYEDGKFRMRFKNQEKSSVSAGRNFRCVKIEAVEDIRILTDISSVEVFINDGKYVFSTRYYPDKYMINIKAQDAEISLMEITI